MKKAGVIFYIIIMAVLLTIPVLSQSDGEDPGSTTSDSNVGIEAAYQCLEDILDGKEKADLSLQEAMFSTLALGSDSKLEDVIESQKNSNKSESLWSG